MDCSSCKAHHLVHLEKGRTRSTRRSGDHLVDPRNTDAELYNAAPASTNTVVDISSDDGLYDAPFLGSNDECLTVTAYRNIS